MASLRIAIIGSGAGGLSLARTLRHRGAAASVRVYELNDKVHARGGGITMREGAAVLDRVGLREELTERSTEYLCLEVSHDSEKLAGIHRSFGYQIMRQDLQQMLFDSVGGEETVRLGAEVKAVEETDDGVKITLADGTVDEADLIVGADGIRSTVAAACFEDVGEPIWTGYQMLYALTRERVRKDPNLLTVNLGTSKATGTVTGGEKRYYKMSFTAGAGKYRHDACCITREVGEPVSSAWDSTIVLPEMQEVAQSAYPDNHDGCLDIIAGSDRIFAWGIYQQPLRPTWISRKGRAVLLGDAAHATSPFSGQGGNMAIQDGFCLGRLLADNLDGKNKEEFDLGSVLSEYEKIRKGPCEDVMKNSTKIAESHFAKGWKASARNMFWRGLNLMAPLFPGKPYDKNMDLKV